MASSQRFNPDIYHLENRNHTARVRDKKRPVYMGFLRWIEDQPGLNSYAWQSDKATYLAEVMDAFPGLQASYQQSQARLAQSKAVRACFNGEVVSHITGLTGKPLGGFMAHLKRERGDELGGLPALTAEQLHAWVGQAYAQFTATP